MGKVHYFNHGKENAFYTMGVTLSAGHSLSWFEENFAENDTFEELLADLKNVPIGSNYLLFTPYLVGERTQHADATIHGSFIGMDASHKKRGFTRAVIEGIKHFHYVNQLKSFGESGKEITSIVSIGGGAKK